MELSDLLKVATLLLMADPIVVSDTVPVPLSWCPLIRISLLVFVVRFLRISKGINVSLDLADRDLDGAAMALLELTALMPAMNRSRIVQILPFRRARKVPAVVDREAEWNRPLMTVVHALGLLMPRRRQCIMLLASPSSWVVLGRIVTKTVELLAETRDCNLLVRVVASVPRVPGLPQMGLARNEIIMLLTAAVGIRVVVGEVMRFVNMIVNRSASICCTVCS